MSIDPKGMMKQVIATIEKSSASAAEGVALSRGK